MILTTINPFGSYLIAFLATWITWRFWKFTLKPSLNPNAPPLLPYWIPFLGHAWGFFRNSNELIAYGRRYFGETGEPFQLDVAGERLIILNDISNYQDFFKNTANLTFDGLLKNLYRTIGLVSEKGLRTLWRSPDEGFESLHPNPKGDPLVHTAIQLLRNQVLRGEPLEMITARSNAYIDKLSSFDRFPPSSVLSSDKRSRVVSLQMWSEQILIEAGTRAVFGEAISIQSPEVFDDINEMHRNSHMLLYKYPGFLSKAATGPRDRTIEALKKYLTLPQAEREDATPFVSEYIDENVQAGLSTEDLAGILCVVLIALNGSVAQASFWLLSILLEDSALLEKITEETRPAVKGLSESSDLSTSQLNIDHHLLLNSCPMLNATFNEVLRTTSNAFNIREVLDPVVLHGKTIAKGCKIIVPHRQLLMDKKGFGSNVNEWDPERFIRDKKLERSPFYRPFGGGTTICSGRYLARREVLSFVAVVLQRYHLEVIKPGQKVLGVEGKQAPRIDMAAPTLGVAAQISGDDVMVVVEKKSV